MPPPELLAVVASAIFLVRLLPQPMRLVRSGVAAGVSPLAVLNGAITDVAWVAHGWTHDLFAVWFVSLLALVPAGWTALLLRRHVRPVDLGGAALWAGTIVLAAVTGSFVAVLAAGVLVTQGPQVVMAARERDLTGISPATWWISLADAAAWGLYGHAIGDQALLLYAAVLTTCSVVVLARIRWTGRVAVPAVAIAAP